MTNLKILAVVIVTVGVYTWVANAIPQIESVVPEELSFSADVTEGELVAGGEELYQSAGCTTCHGLEDRAPNLLAGYRGEGPIGQRCATRVEGQDCKTYLYESITDPQAYMVEGGFDPMVFAASLYSPAQIWALVAFLQAQGGEVTVTGADVAEAEQTAAAAGPAVGVGGVTTAATDPREIMRSTLCFGCHTLGDEGVEVGPPFDGMASRIDADRIRRSILDPSAEAAEGYEHLLGSMPPNLADLLTARQLEIVVGFLSEGT
jgi:mono/diheme cytochrome c family protein